MAEARFSQDEFMCSVCLDLLKDPVTIHCGHSYCKICITDCWDQEDEKSVYSCPQCRQTFSPRPALGKNTILAELVEKLKKTKLPADCYAGAGDVECDVCTGRKHKAVKSCLVCQESYCQTHFDRHEEYHSRKPHKVIDATGRLQDMICRKHDKELEMFCITDQQCICVRCKEYEHKNHNTVSTAAQRTEKQKQLKETQMKIRQRIQQRQKDLHQLREDVKSHKRSAHTAVEDSEKIFTEIIRSIERSRSEATQRIRDQEKTAVSRAEGRLERLEQEINDLRRRDAELEQLSHTQDHIQFLQSFQSLSAPPESTDEPDVPFGSLSSFDGVRESVRRLRDKLEDFCKEEIKKISDGDSHQLTLDLNTVNKRLRLSKKSRVITHTAKEMCRLRHETLAGLSRRDETLAGLSRRDETLTGVFRRDDTLAGVFRRDETLTGVFRRDETLAGVFRRDETLAGVFRRDETLAGVLRRDKTLAGVFRRDETLAGVLRLDETLAGVFRRDDTLAGLSRRDDTLAGLSRRDDTLAGLFRRDETLAGLTGRGQSLAGQTARGQTQAGWSRAGRR
ncbi:E3 ubiquitin/ISG15 ligase TRIM25-like [Pimephales promelas]|uniref:E3 ubiquitin/ISG15 ligase TRIM25-like n=1 Tax=Pimephales promelas TaxID=90988 RepID=UPI0019556A00|nr:E3 ubiquitin/ISG15 ligase TRIM25-like [Pimephales promelas]